MLGRVGEGAGGGFRRRRRPEATAASAPVNWPTVGAGWWPGMVQRGRGKAMVCSGSDGGDRKRELDCGGGHGGRQTELGRVLAPGGLEARLL